TEAEVDEALALPRLRARRIDLEHEQTGGKLRPTLGEGVQPRSEDDVLSDAMGSLFRDEIFDEAGAGHDGGAEGPRERAHVRTASPSLVWSRQLQANFVFEHVGRRIDFYVSARHKATRTAVSSGAATCLSCMTFSLSRFS